MFKDGISTLTIAELSHLIARTYVSLFISQIL